MEKVPIESYETPKEKTLKANLLQFAYELGTWIVLPLVILIFAGVWFDNKFDTKPLGIIIGLLLSIIPTSTAIAKKVKKFNQQS